MKCPRDGTVLQRVSVLGIELDKCHKCDGIWCDPGEMERLRDSEVTDIEEKIEAEYGSPSFEAGAVEGYMQCPSCAGRLQRVRHTFINPVVIDRCESCLGMWLDDGELDAIVGEKKEIDEKYAPGRLRMFLRGMANKLGGR